MQHVFHHYLKFCIKICEPLLLWYIDMRIKLKIKDTEQEDNY